MPRYAEIEIALHKSDAGSYQAELRFTDPENEAELPPARGTVAFDLEELRALQADDEAYGHALAASLFGDESSDLPELYGKTRAAVEAGGRLLRLRLFVGPSAAELHALRWELLRDPETGTLLATSERILFSRFLVSHDWRSVRLRRKADLRALVAVAAPSDAETYQLAEVDKDGEIRRARESLDGIDVTVAGDDEPLTLERLVLALREGVDVLYLVCHGVLSRRQVPYLLLQNDDGTTARVSGQDLADRLAELTEPPRLVVLASCQSGGTEDGTDAAGRATALASLAPRLARAGVPAILAMQGRVTMATVEKAMPVFFRELLQDGQIDRALAVARGHVRERPDAWMPALYLRLKRGLIWYEPGFAGVRDEAVKWKSICGCVQAGRFIPILGPELGEHVCGTSRELAERLARDHGFPLAPHERSDLAKVTQYLTITQDRKYVRRQVLERLRELTLSRNRDLLQNDAEKPLPELLDEIARARSPDEEDPYRILADLEGEVYVTASAETLLYKFLKEAGKEPELLRCNWRSTPESHPQPPPFTGKPTSQEPVVYHVFGVFPEWSSLVLTEDEFFDYLIESSTYKLTPKVVTGALTEGSLLFLGFQLNDWRFRVLFRQVMMLEGSHGLTDYSHVGVQVEPDESRLTDVEQARRYLEQYYVNTNRTGRVEPRIDVYWGTAADFLKDLKKRLDATPKPATRVEPATKNGGGWF